MQREDELTPVETELQAALSTLDPARARLDHDGLLFRAGQVSARRRTRSWQCAAAVLAVSLAASVSLQIWHEPVQSDGPTVVDRPAPGPAPTLVTKSPLTPAQPLDGAYVRVRNDVLDKGLDVLAKPAGRAFVRRARSLRELRSLPAPEKL